MSHSSKRPLRCLWAEGHDQCEEDDEETGEKEDDLNQCFMACEERINVEDGDIYSSLKRLLKG